MSKLSDFAELKLLIDEYDPSQSDWNFRKNVLLDILVRIWPKESDFMCDEGDHPAGSHGDKCFACFVYNEDREASTAS